MKNGQRSFLFLFGLLLIACAGLQASAQQGNIPITKKKVTTTIVDTNQRQREVQVTDKSKVNTEPGADAPPYQELRCRGGGLRFRLPFADGRTTSSGEQTKVMIVDFQPADQAADPSGRNLQPGQCAFSERFVGTGWPGQIVQEIVDFAQLKQQQHGDKVDLSPTAAEKYPDAQNVPKYLSDAKHYWIFFVRPTGWLPQGQFEASNGRAWKPGKENEVVIPNSNRNKDRERVLKPGPQ